MAISMVVYGGDTLIDLTGDTVEEETLAEGATAHNARGEPITGKMPTTTVLYTEQTLTKAQKEQARKNIGITGTSSVTDYGAKGDGTTDDTAAFQTALSENRVVFVPGGTYKLSGGLVVGETCELQLARDVVLNFTQTSGNCISLEMSASLRGNHATVRVPYTFGGNVVYASTTTTKDQSAVPPFAKWDPQWKTGHYITDLNIVKPDSLGRHYSEDGTCYGTAVYLHNDANASSNFMWGINHSGIRIAGGFSYGYRVENVNGGWTNDMRIEALIDACEIGVSLEDAEEAFLSVCVQPRRAENASGTTKTYAKHGIQLINSRNVDLSSSRVWDWNAANSLWTEGGQYQHIAMIGECRGLIVNDFLYHEQSNKDIRSLFYTDNESNLEKMTILQEPITRWFKPKDGEPYFFNGNGEKKLALMDDLDAHFTTDKVIGFTDVLPTAVGLDGEVFNGIGYIRSGKFWAMTAAALNDNSGAFGCTGLIACKPGDTIYTEGISLATGGNDCRIVMYDKDFGHVAFVNQSTLISNASSYASYRELKNGCAITINNVVAVANTAYVALNFLTSSLGADPMVAVNEEIKYTYEGFLADGIKVKADNVVGLVNGGDSSGSGENTGTDEPIKELDVTLTPAEQLEVDFTISTLQNLKKANTATIAFLTDLHTADANGGNETKIKKAISGYNAISSAVKTDLLLLGGDYMDNNPTTTKEKALGWYSNLRDVIDCRNSKPPMAVIKGNHDDNTMYTDYANGLVDIETFWEVFGDIDNERTVRDGGNIEDCYGYYDIPNKKIRVFYLNTVDIPQKFYEVLNKLNYRAQWDTGISINQLQFVSDNLKFDDYGWRVMVFTHHPLMYNIAIENGCGVKADRGGTALLELLDKFNSGNTAGSISVTAQDFAGTVTYDFTDNKDCKIVACVNGHTHRDSVDVYNDSFFCISTRAVSANCSAYFVVDRNENKLHLVYNGDGEEKVFNYDSLSIGEAEEPTDPVYEQIDSPYTFGINNLNYDTGEPVYDSQELWLVSNEICGFTKPALIDFSGYSCNYNIVLFVEDGNYIGLGNSGWADKAKPWEVSAGQTLRIIARNANWSAWTEDSAATFTSAIKIYIEEGGEYYIVGGSDPDATTEVIASPFEWAIGQVSGTTGESTSDSQNMRISSTEPIGFTTAATIDMSAYSCMYALYLYDTDGNFVGHGDGWVSSATPLEVPVDKMVRIKVRHNDYGVWTDESINTFASAIKVTVDKGGESYTVSGSAPDPDVSMTEIESPFTFAYNNVSNYETGTIVSDESQKLRILSNEIVGFTTPATVDLSGYNATCAVLLYDTDGNYISNDSWASTATPIAVPVDKTIRLLVRGNNWGAWTAESANAFASAIKIYVEGSGEAYIVNGSGSDSDL